MSFTKPLIFIFILFFFISKTYAVPGRKEIKAIKINKSPKIDGIIDEDIWLKAETAVDFFQMSPYNGAAAINPTEVKILFDNNAIYVAAIMHDPAPDSIRNFFSLRDDMADSDNIGISFNPFNDGIISYHFIVTAAGVQVDMRSSTIGANGFDRNWDAVWDSEVRKNGQGWTAEIKIPFSALRVPSSNTGGWGFNVIRVDKRKPEQTSWNFIDSKIPGFDTQMGLLSGITGIETPLRLSFTPYLAGYLNKQTGFDEPGYSLKGGMDVKLGLTDSYTLDMMLIPDFGEVQADEEILNLTPYEIQYDEKRQFFTEGGDLFSKADIFYSRRIGQQPIFHSEAYSQTGENEIVNNNPIESQIINATKLTGKSKNGLSVGILNAMTSSTYATIKDTLNGQTRTYRTQPFTNYNVTVLDQTLKNNSFFSVINTNATMIGREFMSNVLGFQTKLANKQNTYAIFAKGGYAHNQFEGLKKNGGYYDLALAKIKGNFQVNLNSILKSDQYDPNVMGYEKIKNILVNQATFEYNIYDPFWILMSWDNSLTTIHTSQYKPREFSQFELKASTSATFKNYLQFGLSITYSPESFDFHEPRKFGLYFTRPALNTAEIQFSTDERKKFSMETEYLFGTSSTYKYSMNGFSFTPKYRFSNRFFMEYELNNIYTKNDLGYLGKNQVMDTVFFARRDIVNIQNKVNFIYSFTNKASLSFIARHYWSKLNNRQTYSLEDKGLLKENNDFVANHLNFNVFNIDMLYSWNFAPGSTISVVYKNAIQKRNGDTDIRFAKNFMEMISSPQINSISVKILFYLDYQNLKKQKAQLLSAAKL
jgi:hypothetical protein